MQRNPLPQALAEAVAHKVASCGALTTLCIGPEAWHMAKL